VGAGEDPTTEDLELGPEMKAKIREVIMKTTATPVVILPKKVVAPELPKIVWLDPPKAAPMLAPLPVWSKTIRISPMQTIMWIITINTVIVYFMLS
jgi:hypothetical protein